MSEASDRSRLLAPLRHRDFRRVLAAQATSSLGDSIGAIALVVGLIRTHHGAGEIAVVFGAQTVGVIAVLIIGGALADRYRRSRIMVIADLLRIVAVAVFVVSNLDAPLFVLAGAALLSGVGAALFRPAYGALLRGLVEDHELRAANSLRATTRQATRVIGPLIGGLIVVVATSRTAFIIDGLTFAVSVVSSATLRDAPVARRVDESFRRALAGGFEEIWKRPWLSTVVIQGTIQVGLCIAPMAVLLPIVFGEQDRLSLLGAVVAAEGLGSVLGGLAAGRWQPRLRGLWGMSALALFALPLAALAFRAPVWAYLVGFLLAGVGHSMFAVWWQTALHENVPQDRLGRVMSVDQVAALLINPVGLVATPLLISSFGAPATAATAAVIALVSSIVPVFLPGVARFGEAEGTPSASGVPMPTSP